MSTHADNPPSLSDLTGQRVGPRGRIVNLPLWGWAVVVVLSLAWDRAFWLHVSIHDHDRAALLPSKDWYAALRILGFIGTWAGVAVLLWLIDLGHRGWWKRGAYLLGSAIAGGAAAEILKPIVGRLRPEETDGWYVFLDLGERISRNSDLGMASSHTGVAFGAAAAMARLVPSAWPVFLLGAAGTAMTRIIAGAHFLSDCVVGAMLGYACAWAIWQIDPRNRRAATPEAEASASAKGAEEGDD